MDSVRQSAIVGSALFGLATIGLGIVMLFIFPTSADLAEGFRTPIIAFEFAETEADLAFLAGNGETGVLNRQKMEAGHRWDMVFPFAYAGFIGMMLWHLATQGHHWLWAGIACALLIIPFDIQENLVLLAITEALENAEPVETLLQELHVATWLKWGALGASIGGLSLGLFAEKSYFSAGLSAVAAMAVAACWFSGSAPLVAEVMSAAISLFFIYFTVTMSLQAVRATSR